MKFSLLAALLPGAWSLLFADQIVLKNGDRITGTRVKKDGLTRYLERRWCSSAAPGALAARAGGAPVVAGALRVTCRGAFAMAATAGAGALFGTSV